MRNLALAKPFSPPVRGSYAQASAQLVPPHPTSAIRALPIMISGIPLVRSRTSFLTQSAAATLDATASSALSNMLMVMITPGRHPAGSSL